MGFARRHTRRPTPSIRRPRHPRSPSVCTPRTDARVFSFSRLLLCSSVVEGLRMNRSGPPFLKQQVSCLLSRSRHIARTFFSTGREIAISLSAAGSPLHQLRHPDGQRVFQTREQRKDASLPRSLAQSCRLRHQNVDRFRWRARTMGSRAFERTNTYRRKLLDTSQVHRSHSFAPP